MRLNRLRATVLSFIVVALGLGALAGAASASHRQLMMIEDGVHLANNTQRTMQRFRELGASTIRVIVSWSYIAPDATSRHRPSFNATDPAAYPAGTWVRWDNIVKEAHKDGLQVDFTLSGGAPLWAEGSDIPQHIVGNLNRAWKPSSVEFGKFVQAIGRRYSGSYRDPADPGHNLPAVHFWSVWNEPNFGEDLGPEAIDGSSVDLAPRMYRNLVAAAWNGLRRTGHGGDTIIIGGLTARGQRSSPSPSNPGGHPGSFAQMKPLEFIRHLYCVDNSFHPMRGSIAKKEGCPTTAAARRSFRSKNPGLFQADGFAEHPYPQNLPPDRNNSDDNDSNFVTFKTLPREMRTLDRVTHLYGSHKRYSIYVDEYGYITNPPNRSGHFVSPTTAAYYLNWYEYLSWRSPRIASVMQFLLYDPAYIPGKSGFTSGLLFVNGRPKPGFDAYRLPLYLPKTSMKRGHRVEVWGDVRPAHYIAGDTGDRQTAEIQFQRHSRGSFKTLKKVRITSPRGYFDLHMSFPASGTVRLTWTYPHSDPFLPISALGSQVHGRSVKIRVG
jgi:hypothetical protein